MAAIEDVVKRIMDIRAQRASNKAKFKEEDDKLAAMEERGEGWLLDNIQKMGVDSVKTAFGTVYTQVKSRSSIGDWATFTDWAIKTQNVDLLQHRINEDNLKTYLGSGAGLPPGVTTSPVRVVVVRKP